MFNQLVDRTKFSDAVADGMFQRIRAVSQYRNDVSFLTTMRILLDSRIPEDESVTLSYYEDMFPGSDLSGNADETIINYFVPVVDTDSGNGNWIRVVGVGARTKEAMDGIMDIFGKSFTTVYPEFEELEDLRVFVSKQMNARFYICRETKKTVVVISAITPAKWHFAQVFLSRLMPWYFKDINRELTEAEKVFVFSIAEGKYDKYIECVNEYAKTYDFRTGAIKGLFKGFGTKIRSSQIDNLNRQLGRIENRIDDVMNEYRNYLAQRDEYIIRITGINALASQAEEMEADLTDYFLANKNLNNVKLENGTLSFIVTTYIDGFNSDMYETFAKRSDSIVYTGYDAPAAFEDSADKKLFFDAIFGSDPKLRIKVCGFYKLDITGYADSIAGYDYGVDFEGYIPNPHLQNFNCLGDHKRYIEECLRNNDIIGAVAQCQESCGSINIGEDPTMRKFFKALLRSSKKIIELPDGTAVTPKEALKWLKKG